MLRRRDMITALLLPFLAILVMCTAASVAPGEDVFLARSLESYVIKRAEASRHKIDSISIKKIDGTIEEGVYKSTWDLVVRYRLGYVRPEEDPFLSGMQKCLTELKPSSSKEWAEWALSEIAARREEVLDAMAVAQESPERIVAFASVSANGYIDASTIKLQLSGAGSPVPIDELRQIVPDTSALEAAGYKYLADARDETSGGPSSGSTSGTTGSPGSSTDTPATKPTGASSSAPTPQTADAPQTPAAPGSPAAPGKPATRPASNYSPQPTSTHLILWSLGILSLLLLILVIAETHRQKKQPPA